MSNKQIKVSVIVPVYNTEKYLDRCMESLLRQTLPEIEIIVIDDGSKAVCAEKCDQWKKRDSRIHVIHKKNQGLGFARNTGIEAANGKYLVFIDSDDYVESEMCKTLYEEAEREKADIVVAGYKKVYPNGKEEICNNERIPKVLKGKQVISVLLANMLGAPPNYYSDDYIGMSVWKNLYSREIVKKYKIRFPSEREYISEDIIFHIYFLQHVKKAVVLPDAFYCYCQNGDSLTTTYKKNRFYMVKKLYLYEEKLLKEIGAYEVGKLQLMRTFIANVRVCIMQEVAFGIKNHSVRDTKKRIKEYCKDRTVQHVLAQYPYYRLPFRQKIFSFFMKIQGANILFVLAAAQNYSNLNAGRTGSHVECVEY